MEWGSLRRARRGWRLASPAVSTESSGISYFSSALCAKRHRCLTIRYAISVCSRNKFDAKYRYWTWQEITVPPRGAKHF
jgi:hypothetical protein